MARWTANGLKRGVDDAIQGVRIVVSNPHLRQHKFLRIFLLLVVLSVVLFGLTHLLLTIPLRIIKYVTLRYIGPGRDISKVDRLLTTAHRTILDIVSYVPVLALLFMRYVYPKPLDDLFMETLHYIDQLNNNNNNNNNSKDDLPQPTYAGAMAKRSYRKEYWPNMKSYVQRTWKKVRFGLLIFLLSFLPVVGRFVIPATGAYATFRSLGKTQGIAVGVCFFLLPHWTTMRLVRGLIGMRTLMRELLEPYFVRMKMSHSEKKQWFSGRKDVLFGFSMVAYLLIRVPYLGFVGYGVAQAAAAYMLTTVVSVEEINRLSPALRENSVDALEISEKKMVTSTLD